LIFFCHLPWPVFLLWKQWPTRLVWLWGNRAW
jgi:hypothetical protein